MSKIHRNRTSSLNLGLFSSILRLLLVEKNISFFLPLLWLISCYFIVEHCSKTRDLERPTMSFILRDTSKNVLLLCARPTNSQYFLQSNFTATFLCFDAVKMPISKSVKGVRLFMSIIDDSKKQRESFCMFLVNVTCQQNSLYWSHP